MIVAERKRQRPGTPARRADAAEQSGILMAIVHARGVIDAEHVEPFARELGRGVEAGATNVIVDLSSAEEVTTAGMNALLAARQSLVERGGQIAVVTSHWLRLRLEVLQLERRFLLADDRLQAVQLLGLAGGHNQDTGIQKSRAVAA